jgi:hydroxypyruvate isomerase
MPRFSANLGFLWSELPLPDAILAAHAAGFDAVECHWPYDHATDAVIAALDQRGLPMLALNTPRGDINKDEFGLCAIPARQDEARQGIRDAISYASQIGAKAVHVMAGKVLSDNTLANQEYRDHFIDMLAFAAQLAEPHGIEIWIEAINPLDVPGYILNTPRQAVDILKSLSASLSVSNIGLMFDCYHVGRMINHMGGMEGNNSDILAELDFCLPWVKHIQIATIPDRTEPDHGDVDYPQIYSWLDAHGYDGFIGAEYKPRHAVEDGLGWLHAATS